MFHQTCLLTTNVDTIPGLIGSAGSAGTDGDDIINGQWGNELVGTTLVAAATLTSLDGIDGGLGQNTLNVNIRDASSALTAVNTTRVQTVNVKSVGAATVDTTSGFTGVTKLNITQAIGNVTATAAATTAIDVSGVTGTALGVKEVFTATFAGTEVGNDTTIVFDGVTSTLAAAVGGTLLAADFVSDYTAAGTGNWDAADNGDGTVTFTAKVVGTKTDIVTANFVVTDPGAGDTTPVTVTAAAPTTQGSGAAGTTTTVDGGSSQTVSVAKGGVTVGATTVTTGDISVTSSDQGIDTIAVDGGKAVTVKSTGSTGGAITVGQGLAPADFATGAVGITSAHKGVAATDVAMGAITVSGGSTVTVTQTADASKAAADLTGATLTQGAVKVTAGTATTSVTVNQAKSVAEVAALTAVAGVTETASVKFGALKSGDKLIVGGDGDATLESGELQFTAAKDLTAAEVAQAFAGLTNPDAQAGGMVANGIYQSFSTPPAVLFTSWTSGAATGDTVVFTSTGAGSVTDLAFNLAGTGTAPVVTTTEGSGGAAGNPGVLGVITGAVTIDDNATAASITTVTLDSYGITGIGATNTLSKLQTLNLSNSGGAAAGATNAGVTVDAVGVTTLALNLNNVQGNVSLDGGAASVATLNVTNSGADSAFALTAAAVKTLTVAGDKKATFSTDLVLLETVTVTGTAGLTLSGNEDNTLTAVTTTGTTGVVSAAIDGTKATYTGGAGVDIVTLKTGTSLTKAIDLGDGDDTLIFDAAVAGSTALLFGGAGTDTLSMKTVSAEALDGAAQTFYTGFERLLISDASIGTIDLANLGFTNYVTTSGSGGTLTLNNLASNGTVVMTAANTTGMTVGVKDAATGETDVLNVIAQVTVADINFGTVTAANVETINLTAIDGNTTTIDTATLVLTADKATTVNLGSSNANLALTLTGSTKVSLVDGSLMTGNLTLTANGAATGTEIRGGSGNDTLTAVGENDVLKGNGGNDTFNLVDLTSAYGGAGADIFNFAINSNLSKVSTIHELGAGDVINLKHGAGLVVTKFFAEGAQYNPNTTNGVAGKVDAALKDTAAGQASWFNEAGNTYIVIDGVDSVVGFAETYEAGADIVIEIIGEFNLGTGAAFNTVSGTLEIL